MEGAAEGLQPTSFNYRHHSRDETAYQADTREKQCHSNQRTRKPAQTRAQGEGAVNSDPSTMTQLRLKRRSGLQLTNSEAQEKERPPIREAQENKRPAICGARTRPAVCEARRKGRPAACKARITACNCKHDRRSGGGQQLLQPTNSVTQGKDQPATCEAEKKKERPTACNQLPAHINRRVACQLTA